MTAAVGADLIGAGCATGAPTAEGRAAATGAAAARAAGTADAGAAPVLSAGAGAAPPEPAGPPGGSVGNLIVGAAEGLGGRLIRTVSFLG